MQNIWGGMQALTQISKWKKGHDSNNLLARYAFSRLYSGVMFANNYAKNKSNMSMDLENIWDGTQSLTQNHQ